MHRFVVLAVLLLALTGCATDGTGAPPAISAERTDDTLVAALDRWDAAAVADDAHELLITSRTLPWHVVRDCGPNLDPAQREAIVADGEAALGALADAEEEQDAPLAAATIVDLFEPYVENVRRSCL